MSDGADGPPGRWPIRRLRTGLLVVIVGMAFLTVACTGRSGSPLVPAAGTVSGGNGGHPAATPPNGTPAASVTAVVASVTSSSTVFDCRASCFTPGQFRIAYGIQPLLDRGIDGRGETVTILAAAPPRGATAPAATDIRQDLADFDSAFRLPAARIQIVTSLAGAASPWRAAGEEAGDFEILHAVAPAATLRVVLMPASAFASAGNATADMLAGLRLAVSGTDVASISWSLGEHFFTRAQVAEMNSILQAAAARHVTVVSSSGDHGTLSDTRFGSNPVKEVSLPAADPLVLGVGGTTLTANGSTGAYIRETAWNQGAAGSGGGFSDLYARPAYQQGVPGVGSMRGVPDVAGDAGEQGGITLGTIGAGGKFLIAATAGTSAATPLWGGLMALADQYAHRDLGSVNPALYRIARGSAYHQAFHDITAGDNSMSWGTVTFTGYQAAPGWDPVTGWGSPNAQVLVPLLARSAG
jgi:subtilase family serine protease